MVGNPMTTKTLAEQLRKPWFKGMPDDSVWHRIDYQRAEAADALDAKDAEIARLRAALKKRDGWQHDMDCGLASGGYCDCGHTEARAALRK